MAAGSLSFAGTKLNRRSQKYMGKFSAYKKAAPESRTAWTNCQYSHMNRWQPYKPLKFRRVLYDQD